jgi:hypothetical protein
MLGLRYAASRTMVNHPSPREAVAFPAKSVRDYKFWPLVARVDNLFARHPREHY